eukprot:jgi/Mesvir1/26904/Mv20632-RA.1
MADSQTQCTLSKPLATLAKSSEPVLLGQAAIATPPPPPPNFHPEELRHLKGVDNGNPHPLGYMPDDVRYYLAHPFFCPAGKKPLYPPHFATAPLGHFDVKNGWIVKCNNTHAFNEATGFWEELPPLVPSFPAPIVNRSDVHAGYKGAPLSSCHVPQCQRLARSDGACTCESEWRNTASAARARETGAGGLPL